MLSPRNGWTWPVPGIVILFLATFSCGPSEPTRERMRSPNKAEDVHEAQAEVQGMPGKFGLAMPSQVRMADPAGIATETTMTLSGDSLEGIYQITLAECLRAGRSSFRELQVEFSRQESHTTWGSVDGSRGDSTPVRIRGETLGELRLRVLFTVGTRSDKGNKAFVRILKESFERQLTLASRADE